MHLFEEIIQLPMEKEEQISLKIISNKKKTIKIVVGNCDRENRKQ